MDHYGNYGLCKIKRVNIKSRLSNNELQQGVIYTSAYITKYKTIIDRRIGGLQDRRIEGKKNRRTE